LLFVNKTHRLHLNEMIDPYSLKVKKNNNFLNPIKLYHKQKLIPTKYPTFLLKNNSLIKFYINYKAITPR